MVMLMTLIIVSEFTLHQEKELGKSRRILDSQSSEPELTSTAVWAWYVTQIQMQI